MSKYFLVYGDKIEESQKVLLVVTTDLTLARAKYLANQRLENLAKEGKIAEPFVDYESLDLLELDLFATVKKETIESHLLPNNNHVNLKLKELLPADPKRKEPIAEYRSTATEDVEKLIAAAKKAEKKAGEDKKDKKAKKAPKAKKAEKAKK